MWTLPSMQQGDALIGSDMADAGSGSSLLYGSIRLQHPWEIIPVLYFYKNTKEKMFRSKLLLKMLCPMGGVRVGSIAPSFTATPPDVADYPEVLQIASRTI